MIYTGQFVNVKASTIDVIIPLRRQKSENDSKNICGENKPYFSTFSAKEVNQCL